MLGRSKHPLENLSKGSCKHHRQKSLDRVPGPLNFKLSSIPASPFAPKGSNSTFARIARSPKPVASFHLSLESFCSGNRRVQFIPTSSRLNARGLSPRSRLRESCNNKLRSRVRACPLRSALGKYTDQRSCLHRRQVFIGRELTMFPRLTARARESDGAGRIAIGDRRYKSAFSNPRFFQHPRWPRFPVRVVRLSIPS